MGAVDPESFDTLHSFSNAFEMPFVTPWFPEKNFGNISFKLDQSLVKYADGDIRLTLTLFPDSEDPVQNFAVQMTPQYHNAIVDLIHHYDWRSVIYIFSSSEGLYRLQQIYENIPKVRSYILFYDYYFTRAFEWFQSHLQASGSALNLQNKAKGSDILFNTPSYSKGYVVLLYGHFYIYIAKMSTLIKSRS